MLTYLTCTGTAQAFLEDDARLVMNFFADSTIISGAGKAFWQAELYLRRMQETPGEAYYDYYH